ncbi:hypothetical protein [Flagellimonas onchidii]|uniref:hypothetical protein n=1 Tax=Flagellimonas onchidii TaxID=2562684 RepID=UPI0010A5DD73|nr:hypothetical protein [Allomuricauda onchidii]
MKHKISILGLLAVLMNIVCVAQTLPEYRLKEGTRQIHLDFHTSGKIEDIGKKFNKKQFQEALKAGHVNSINVFAKGHHSWAYYNTKAGMRHPHLDFDLLKAQIEACHEIGVRVQAYITVGWSVQDALKNPEWETLNKQGKAAFREATKNLKPGDRMPWGWPELSPEGAYLDLILAQTEEIVRDYDVDGIWYDIIPFDKVNFNEASKKDMKANGVDMDDPVATKEYHAKKMKVFMEKSSQMVKKYKPNASLFYNWTTHLSANGNTFKHSFYNYNTKQDLEDLPTTWGGYDILPMRAKFFANTGKPLVAMSGKFHTSWGEFGGFKHKDAILYEAAAMVAFGASPNFGDQLHPSGEMDMGTYTNIGHAFEYVEKIEDYGIGAEHYASLGLWMTLNNRADEGLTRMLLENQYNFEVVNNLQDWSHIKTIILPSSARLNSEDVKRLKTFQTSGGSIVTMGRGTLDFETEKFLLDFDIDYIGHPEKDNDYTVVKPAIGEGIVPTPFLNYEPALRVKPKAGTEVLATIREPYFSRTLGYFSSHANTPNKLEDAAHPAVVKSNNSVYFAHALDNAYFTHGARIHRDLFINGLKQVHNSRYLEVDLPSAGRANLLHQPDKKRYVAHLLYAAAHQRGRAQVIEDLVPIHNTTVKVRLSEKVKKAYLIPSGKPLKIEKEGDAIVVEVEKFTAHTAVVFEY